MQPPWSLYYGAEFFLHALRNCTPANIASLSGFSNSGVQLRHISVELKAQAVGLSARGFNLPTYFLNEWVCTCMYKYNTYALREKEA